MTHDPLQRLRGADPLRGELPRPLPGPPALPRRRRASGRALPVANAGLLLAVAAHAVDHALVQDRGLGELELHVLLAGVSMGATSLLSLVAALVRLPSARPIAAATGVWVAALAAVGHFGPAGMLDSYAGLGLGAFSWGAAGAVVVAGVAVALAAARRRGQ